MTSTLVRSEPTVPERSWRADRRPAVIAVVAVVLATAAFWGLHWWGPVNPAVGFTEYGVYPPDDVILEVTNSSHSPLTVESVEIHTATAWSPVLRSTTTTDVVIPARSVGYVHGTVPICDGSVATGTYHATLGIRSAVGRHLSITGPLLRDITCQALLPPAGVQPADAEAARTGVTSAFWTAYDSSRPAADRLAAIDEPAGIAEGYERSLAGPMGTVVGLVRADVGEIVFDRPDHAYVRYVLAYSGNDQPRVGQATLVDGTWKVARSTVCTDLALVQITCSS